MQSILRYKLFCRKASSQSYFVANCSDQVQEQKKVISKQQSGKEQHLGLGLGLNGYFSGPDVVNNNSCSILILS